MEALSSTSALVIFVVGFLLGAYLMFARAWLQYQSEQALYCLAEGKPVAVCRRDLAMKVSAALPWGALESSRLVTSARGWEVEVRWRFQQFDFVITRQLDSRRILRNRGLRW